MKIYNHKKLEKKWLEYWNNAQVYQPDLKIAKSPYYNLMMFPYPSAEGLHVGNMYAFTGSDVWGRYQRMKGHDVFEPIGLDGFGIHSENYAIKVGKHPAEQAKKSEVNFYRQLRSIGNGFSWENRLETYDPEYYKWTQWLFVQMFKAGLVERKKSMVNWCPSCKTVLADEQVEAGVCERCKSEVVKKGMEQWFFRITKYADRLLENIDGKEQRANGKEQMATSKWQMASGEEKDYDPVKHGLRWPETIKTAQRNWIGKKLGINITYSIKDAKETVTCFTTRPDTNFGATFIVLAPEHELVSKLMNSKFQIPNSNVEKVRNYVERALKKTEQQRMKEGKEKTGVFTGLYAVNQLNGYKMPVFVADFVLKDVGTGAVVGVPGHDTRDFEFAKAFDLPVKRVVVANDGDRSDITKIEQVQEAEGKMINSGFLDGMDIHEATKKIMDYMIREKQGEKVTSYHLRDWLISRQRYWGPPIPMIFCESCAEKGKTFKGVSSKGMVGWWPVPEKDLPVELPYVKDYQPIGEGKSPLEKAPKEWLEVKCPECGKTARRETDVSDTFLDSAWYFLRYPSIGLNSKSQILNPKQIKNSKSKTQKNLEFRNSSLEFPWNREVTRRWLPVNAYIGGAEHAVLHLLYARFMWMFLKDAKLLDARGDEPFPFLVSHGLIVKDGKKMSKSRGNVVVPDDYIAKYGADTLRVYLMFVGDYRQGGDFRDTGIAAMHRFLERVWDLYSSADGKIGDTTTPEMKRQVEQCVRDVTQRIERFKYNTAISALMELMNLWRDQVKNEKVKTKSVISREDAGRVLKLLAPFAPFMTEELYQHMSADNGQWTMENGKFMKNNSIHLSEWPEWDEGALKEDIVTIVIQVNGKLRGQVEIDVGDAKDEKVVLKKAKVEVGVKKWIKDKKVQKEVFVPGRLVNLVVG